MLRLIVLRLDGRAIAALYAFAAGDRTWFAAIERAAAEGHRAFDFLRGAEPYKYWWGARNTVTTRRSVSFG